MSRTRRSRSKSAAPSSAAPQSSALAWPKVVTLVLAVICLLGLFSTRIGDTDFWWHLKTGEFITQNHSLPFPDPFAYTSSAAPAYAGEQQVRRFNLTHEWLSQVLMFAVYEIGGFGGIIAARALLLAAICALAGLLAARLSASFYVGVAAAFATASVLVSFTADRPGVITFLGVAGFITLLETRRYWWALPPLALLWANCHGGFFLGWLVLLAYAVEFRSNRRFWLIAGCTIAASAINPNGLAVLSILAAYRRSPMTANLMEWQPTSLWAAPYSFDLLLYAAALVLLLSWRKVRVAHWILFVAFAALSLSAFRNTPLIGFFAPVLIAAYFPFRFRVPHSLTFAAPIAAAVGAIAILARGMPQPLVATWALPAGAAQFLLDHQIAAPMFNTYEDGGYLIWRVWPQERVFIDGRALSETVYQDYRQILFNPGSASDQVAGVRARLLDRYGIQVVVMNTMDWVSGAMYPLALALANPATPDWDLVYDDPQAIVFLRHAPPATPPLSNKLGRVLRHLDRECETYIANSPDTPGCAATLSAYWLNNQAWDAARRMLTLYLSHAQKPDPRAVQALRDLDAAGH